MLKEEEIFSHSPHLAISPLSQWRLGDHHPTPAMLKAELLGVFVSTATLSMPTGSI
ncbi:hypothetical protein AVDCRST_MAG84-7307 [uncultured Microcoleus sp.]|uniref:Uncharacterized protein n=1 Tax=uncultured Microcoleus sp. TaxID=259945 RepID=A0A6J4PSH4_9CYAN|nr:hypothetical protein AVDCRST_MAG84-7307 [uncultured Microcoleus sp.]